MPTSQTIYLGDLRTQSTHLASGNQIITDAPLDNNGKGEAFSPTDSVASGLAACMMTIMGILANRENIDIVGLKADVTKNMQSNPRKISKIEVAFSLEENKNISKEQGMKLRNAALTCPVALSLNPDIEQVVSFPF
jgi:putative redox protein